MAGSARTLTRSFRQRFRCLISPEVSSCRTPMSDRRCQAHVDRLALRSRTSRRNSSGGTKKRIVLKYAADDDHGMRSHDVNHRISSKFREIVGADHNIVVTAPYIVHTRFE